MKKTKVIFVGMHNKPNKRPLDSSTLSGKRIDSIIENLPYAECVKTNLCDVDYFPGIEELPGFNLDWHEKQEPGEQTIIVLLGRWVQENFVSKKGKVVRLPHPASIYGAIKKDEYVNNSVMKIKSKLQ